MDKKHQHGYKQKMTPKVDNLHILDLYRPNWSVGEVYCHTCENYFITMWPTDTGYAWCDNCKKFAKAEDS